MQLKIFLGGYCYLQWFFLYIPGDVLCESDEYKQVLQEEFHYDGSHHSLLVIHPGNCNTYIPQLKAQVSFSDHLCLLSVHLNFLSICKLFNILDLFSRTKGPILSKTSSMHPSVFKRVRIIGSCTFPRGNYSKRVKWLLQLQIEIFSRMTRPISTKLDTKHPIGEGNQVCFNLGPLSFLWGDDRHI